MNLSSGTRVAVLSFVLITLLFAHPAAGQLRKRLIPFPEWAASNDEDEEIHLELLEINVDSKPITLGQPFEADENWLKNMTLRVKNISSKPIVAFNVGGGLLQGVDEELAPHASFKYGVGWQWGKVSDTKFGKLFNSEKELPTGAILKPGEIVELTYANVGQIYRKPLAKQAEGAFSKLEFMAPTIQFADGEVSTGPSMRFYKNGAP